MRGLADRSPEQLCARLQALGQRRAYAVFDAEAGRVKVSHPELAELASFLEGDRRDYDRHEGVFLEVGRETGALMAAFVHNTRRGQAQGGLRFWPYESTGDLLRDGLRLARGMTRKNALAGLWWGGGKGIIARPPGDQHRDPEFRARLFREYGRFTSSLRGCYYTAEDVGTRPVDIEGVFATTRFCTCTPPAVGGAGNPSPHTARGVVCAMEGALAHLGLGTLAGKSIVMQGTGNVGASMIGELLARDVASIVASDIAEERAAEVRAQFAGRPVEVVVTAPGDASILARPCDILAPNALGGVLNPETIPTIAARIVCGAANNQLLDDDRDGAALRARGIVYVPDFLANRMGIVYCANEQYGQVRDDPAIHRHFGRDWENSVYRVAIRALTLADAEDITTAAAANHLADALASELHPLWGHRGQAIIDGLIADGWETGAS